MTALDQKPRLPFIVRTAGSSAQPLRICIRPASAIGTIDRHYYSQFKGRESEEDDLSDTLLMKNVSGSLAQSRAAKPELPSVPRQQGWWLVARLYRAVPLAKAPKDTSNIRKA